MRCGFLLKIKNDNYMESQMKIATDIDTELFFRMVQFLKENGWKLIAEYDPEIFDKAIDFDYYEFEKDNETIQLAWDIWDEGELKTTDNTLKMLALQFQTEFTFGNSNNIQTALKKYHLMVRY